MKTKENKGVTLIALAVTIIIMLILAGVTISALTGNSGITTNAKKARDAQKNAQTLESLQLMFMDYNIGEKDEETISQYLESKVRSGDIDEFRFYIIDDELKMVIKKDERYFFVRRENEFYTVTEMGTELGEIIPGVTVVTREEFYSLRDNSMKFKLNEGESSTLMFFDEINDPFNLEILGGNVTMYVTQDMSLTNAGMTRSAVDIHPGATLNLYICKGVTMNVDSGYGAEGTTGNALGAEGGKGGYAGIHLPDGATLNLYGKGKLIAYGGNAGTGGGSTSGNRGGGGGGGAGAGIGGNGGDGGQAGTTFTPRLDTNSGSDGKAGENCGTLCIYDELEIYAYGGAGGASGYDSTNNSGSGAGGYPAAGIGGGGAGGRERRCEGNPLHPDGTGRARCLRPPPSHREEGQRVRAACGRRHHVPGYQPQPADQEHHQGSRGQQEGRHHRQRGWPDLPPGGLCRRRRRHRRGHRHSGHGCR